MTAETSSLPVLNASVGGSIVTTAKTSSLSARNASVRGNCYNCRDIITVGAKRFRFAEGVSPVYIGKVLFAMSSFQVARPCSTGFLRPTKTREQANVEFIKSSLASYIEMLTSLNVQRVSFLCAFLVRRGRSKTSSASGPSPHQGAQQLRCLPVPLCCLPKLWCASKGLLVLKSLHTSIRPVTRPQVEYQQHLLSQALL